jgi:hypothetical protein
MISYIINKIKHPRNQTERFAAALRAVYLLGKPLLQTTAKE